MKRNAAKSMALGGVLAALAVVIMCLGGVIPVATYVCPMLCAILLTVVLQFSGRRIAWAWYGAVSILTLLLGPDKEAAIVFVFLGYYPIIKPWLDGRKLSFLWKLLVFNLSIAGMYGMMLYLFQLEQVVADFQGLGIGMTLIAWLLGNIALIMLDVVLGRAVGLKRVAK
jgi:hypothetical protein